jgi:type II secretory pathway component PulK
MVSAEIFKPDYRSRHKIDMMRRILLVPVLCLAGIAAADTVNSNAADAETLINVLKGVGPEKAAAIVDYREQNGQY